MGFHARNASGFAKVENALEQRKTTPGNFGFCILRKPHDMLPPFQYRCIRRQTSRRAPPAADIAIPENGRENPDYFLRPDIARSAATYPCDTGTAHIQPDCFADVPVFPPTTTRGAGRPGLQWQTAGTHPHRSAAWRAAYRTHDADSPPQNPSNET